MDGFSAVLTAVSQVGLPIALVVWFLWFVTVRVWPWFANDQRRALDREVEQGKSAALVAVARSIELLVSTIEASRADAVSTDVRPPVSPP